MNSIHWNQPEETREDLSGEEAVRRIQEIVSKAKSCFFCTTPSPGEPNRARPMNVRKTDDEGNLWFLSARDSHKNREIERDPSVTLYFQGSPHSDFLQLNGEATLSRDQAKIEELWEPIIKTWFTEGVEDPRITVIRFTPRDGYYWDTKHGTAVAGVKMMVGAMTGKTLDDSVEGRLDV